MAEQVDLREDLSWALDCLELCLKRIEAIDGSKPDLADAGLAHARARLKSASDPTQPVCGCDDFPGTCPLHEPAQPQPREGEAAGSSWPLAIEVRVWSNMDGERPIVYDTGPDGNGTSEDPEWRRRIAEAVAQWARVERAGVDPRIIGQPHAELIPVSDELADELRADWSEPVQVKIVDGEMICRRVEGATSDG